MRRNNYPHKNFQNTTRLPVKILVGNNIFHASG